MSGMIKNYEAVAFDLDGTLLNTEQGIVAAVRAAVAELGYEMPKDEVLKTFIGPPMVKSMGETFSLDRAEAERATDLFRSYYAQKYLMQAKPYEGLFVLLEKLKEAGVKIGVATFKRTDYGRKILEGFGIASYCAAICGDNAESTKTKAMIVADCINELGADPAKTLYIGDTRGDYIGASDAGADFAAVTYGFGFKAGEEVVPYGGKAPVLVANSVYDVIKYLIEKDEIEVDAMQKYSYAVGYDKNGAPLARELMALLDEKDIAFADLGVTDDTYYPIVAERTANAMLKANAEGQPARALLVCGTGIGMAISANKIKGVYAAVCHDPYSAERAVLSNNANCFCFGAQVVGTHTAKKLLEVILPLEFKDGRSTPKLAEVYRIEKEQ